MKYPEKTIDYTDKRKFREDLDKHLNAGCALTVTFIPEESIMRIVLFAEALEEEATHGKD